MKFTRKGYGQLRRADDTVVSQHTVPEEAYERASAEPPGVYTWYPARMRSAVRPMTRRRDASMSHNGMRTVPRRSWPCSKSRRDDHGMATVKDHA